MQHWRHPKWAVLGRFQEWFENPCSKKSNLICLALCHHRNSVCSSHVWLHVSPQGCPVSSNDITLHTSIAKFIHAFIHGNSAVRLLSVHAFHGHNVRAGTWTWKKPDNPHYSVWFDNVLKNTLIKINKCCQNILLFFFFFSFFLLLVMRPYCFSKIIKLTDWQ